MERSENCLVKLDRMNKALAHREPDRVPPKPPSHVARLRTCGRKPGWPR